MVEETKIEKQPVEEDKIEKNESATSGTGNVGIERMVYHNNVDGAKKLKCKKPMKAPKRAKPGRGRLDPSTLMETLIATEEWE